MLTLPTHFSTLVLPLSSNNIPSVILSRLFIARVHFVHELPLHHGMNHPHGMIIRHKCLITPDFVKHSSMPIEQECLLLNATSFSACLLIVTHNPLLVTINLSFLNEVHRSINAPRVAKMDAYKSTSIIPTLINGSVIQTQKWYQFHRLLSQMLNLTL